MQSTIYKINGRSSGNKVTLPKHVFGVEPNPHAVYLAVKAYNANSRQGTASTKTRSMVRGGGRKPWRQKGRGVARAGTIRSPLWVGGGRVFGPQPRDYSVKLPKKVKTLARLSVYAEKAKNDQITVVEDFKLENGKTREIFSILKSLGIEKEKTLLLLSEHDPVVLRAGRNIPNLEIRVASTESTYDLLNCKRLVIQKSAIDTISGAFKR
ncbi:50S ribosomal protein L4 [candidate division KSB1 bacterium]|nr:50S ribosomal protein L4 [candidate division KSB1 bacterium]NIR70242.1 50S ribosomal protein L4 [candidate division KSB1 bacterium]NIS26513.1 50S ribosomal protein L4 [candidate division KSB1 bacterium]NIT73275.1 50S ribosomal protein L4 [candidate division KSB1 bacterium]NIU23899.1 50S ribosomal protein L4 [candidate division KSB1 bacterium]